MTATITADDAVRDASQAVFAALTQARAAAVAGHPDAVRQRLAAALARVDDDVRSFSPGAPAVVGRTALEGVWAQLFSTPTAPLFATTPADVAVAASGELAWLRGTFVMHVAGPDGDVPAASGKYLETWRRDPNDPDGTWLLTTGAWNLDA